MNKTYITETLSEIKSVTGVTLYVMKKSKIKAKKVRKTAKYVFGKTSEFHVGIHV
jgi:hypothetical protein